MVSAQVQILFSFSPFLFPLRRLSNTYVMRISDDDYIIGHGYKFDIAETFIRQNFDFEVVDVGDLDARPAADMSWEKNLFKPTEGDSDEEADPKDPLEINARWWEESETLKAARAPASEKRQPKSKKRAAEVDLNDLEESSQEVPKQKKKRKKDKNVSEDENYED
jgi:hypothetical protein